METCTESHLRPDLFGWPTEGSHDAPEAAAPLLVDYARCSGKPCRQACRNTVDPGAKSWRLLQTAFRERREAISRFSGGVLLTLACIHRAQSFIGFLRRGAEMCTGSRRKREGADLASLAEGPQLEGSGQHEAMAEGQGEGLAEDPGEGMADQGEAMAEDQGGYWDDWEDHWSDHRSDAYFDRSIDDVEGPVGATEGHDGSVSGQEEGPAAGMGEGPDETASAAGSGEGVGTSLRDVAQAGNLPVQPRPGVPITEGPGAGMGEGPEETASAAGSGEGSEGPGAGMGEGSEGPGAGMGEGPEETASAADSGEGSEGPAAGMGEGPDETASAADVIDLTTDETPTPIDGVQRRPIDPLEFSRRYGGAPEPAFAVITPLRGLERRIAPFQSASADEMVLPPEDRRPLAAVRVLTAALVVGRFFAGSRSAEKARGRLREALGVLPNASFSPRSRGRCWLGDKPSAEQSSESM